MIKNKEDKHTLTISTERYSENGIKKHEQLFHRLED